MKTIEEKRKHAEYMRNYYRKLSRTVVNCIKCNKELITRNKNRKYCDASCALNKKVELSCKFCSKEIIAKPSYAKRAKFCSQVCAGKSQTGENSKAWKGGTSKERELFQGSLEYKTFRKAVLERDKKCTECGTKEKWLQLDHIKPWALFPEFRLEMDNARILCIDCHKQTDTYGYKAKQLTREMLEAK